MDCFYWTKSSGAFVLDQTQTYQRLAYAGTVPFIACAAALSFELNTQLDSAWLTHALCSYGLLIVSFMCGVHWGTYLYQHKQCPINLFITSNLITLLCWFCVLTEHFTAMLVSQFIAFASLLLLDYSLSKKQIISADYFKTRSYVSLIVMSMLGLTLINLSGVQHA